MTSRPVIAMLVAGASVLGACGSDDGSASDGAATIVVTTTVLGDVVGELVGDQAEVVTIMPVGADPHDFSASARDAAALREADLVVANGGGFEEGLVEVVEGAAADGVPVYEALSAVDPLDLGDGGGSDADPHFFTDPARMADAARGIADELAATVPALDTAAFRDGAEAYALELEELDVEVEAILADIAEDDRLLVTNHDVFAHFADRYGFEIIGTVIPSSTTASGAGAGELAALAAAVEARGVPAVFAETSSPDDVARALAAEVGDDVDVIELYSESLGEAGSDGATYVLMVRTNARRIAGALG